MPFPSVLSTFNQPTPTSRLNSPSHSALHNTVSSAVGQLEAVIGVEGVNSVVGTLEYFIKSPDSNGGGHVQQANVGGTGQTTFTKGDLLVATSSSVIAKLGASSTAGNVLVIDPNQSTGMKWGAVVANKVAINTASVTGSSGQLGGSVLTLYAASILGSTLGTNSGVKFNGVLQKFSSNANFTIVVNYGANVIATTTLTTNSSIIGNQGIIDGIITSGGNISSQVGFVRMGAYTTVEGNTALAPNTGLNYAYGFGAGTASINSDANQNLVITGQYGSSQNVNSILTGLFVVEKIV